MTARTFPMLSLTLVFVAPTTPHDDPPMSRGFSPTRRSRDQVHLSHRPQSSALPSQALSGSCTPGPEFRISLHPKHSIFPCSPRMPQLYPRVLVLTTPYCTKFPKFQVWAPTFASIYTSPGSQGPDSSRIPGPQSHSLVLLNPCPSPTRPLESPLPPTGARALECPQQGRPSFSGLYHTHTLWAHSRSISSSAPSLSPSPYAHLTLPRPSWWIPGVGL